MTLRLARLHSLSPCLESYKTEGFPLHLLYTSTTTATRARSHLARRRISARVCRVLSETLGDHSSRLSKGLLAAKYRRTPGKVPFTLLVVSLPLFCKHGCVCYRTLLLIYGIFESFENLTRAASCTLRLHLLLILSRHRSTL